VEERIEVRCPVIDMMREYFPLVPIIVPLMFPILPAVCLVMYIWRIGQSVRHIEEQLDEILAAVKRIG